MSLLIKSQHKVLILFTLTWTQNEKIKYTRMNNKQSNVNRSISHCFATFSFMAHLKTFKILRHILNKSMRNLIYLHNLNAFDD